MDTRFEESPSQLTLFNFEDLHHILNANWGLRLSHIPTELEQGGCGDAIPLSHLGGAKDSITFVTIAAILLRNQNLDPSIHAQYTSQLTSIFTRYAGFQHQAVTCIPSLMLVYASLVKLTDLPVNAQQLERRLSSVEEDLLMKVYHQAGGALFPCFVFDKTSAYYDALPLLRLHLTYDFNQLLQARLQLNCIFYRNNPFYLLLTDQQERYHTGRDFDAYQLGKAGEASFSVQDIVHHLPISDPNAIAPIWSWLKQQCKVQTNPSLEHSTAKPPTYWQQCSKFCQENKLAVAGMIAVGMFAGYKFLQQQSNLTDEHYPTNTCS